MKFDIRITNENGKVTLTHNGAVLSGLSQIEVMADNSRYRVSFNELAESDQEKAADSPVPGAYTGRYA